MLNPFPMLAKRSSRYLRDIPHNQKPKEIIRNNLIKGLRPKSKSLLDVASQGKFFSKSYDKKEELLNLCLQVTKSIQSQLECSLLYRKQ